MNMRKPKSIYLLLFFVVVAMSASLNAQTMGVVINSQLPTQDPYCVADSALLVGVSNEDKARLCPRVPASGNVTIPEHVVDWILIELRAIDNNGTAGSTQARDANAATLLARKPAFLLSNGRIVDAELYAALGTMSQDPASCTALVQHDNCPEVEFEEIASEVDDVDLYLVIRHRNHLDIISSTHLIESTQAGEAGVYSYNFSSGVSQVLGGVSALKSKGSTFVMYGGDADGNGTIGAGDYSDPTTGVAPQIGSGVYTTADTDFTATVSSGDYSGIIVNNTGAGSLVP